MRFYINQMKKKIGKITFGNQYNKNAILII